MRKNNSKRPNSHALQKGALLKVKNVGNEKASNAQEKASQVNTFALQFPTGAGDHFTPFLQEMSPYIEDFVFNE